MSFAQVRQALSGELSSLQHDISKLMQVAVETGTTEPDYTEAVVISGESKLLNVSEMVADMDKLRYLFDLFEKKPTGCICWMLLVKLKECRFI